MIVSGVPIQSWFISDGYERICHLSTVAQRERAHARGGRATSDTRHAAV